MTPYERGKKLGRYLSIKLKDFRIKKGNNKTGFDQVDVRKVEGYTGSSGNCLCTGPWDCQCDDVMAEYNGRPTLKS